MPVTVTGSWFPSGFHGHFRSHMRNDICQEYRMAARPPPPKAFAQRIKGMGKKKLLQHRDSYNFIYWKPMEEELKRQRPLTSTYRTDFWRVDDDPGSAPQLLVPRMNRATAASYSEVTTYRDMMRSHANLKTSEHSALTGGPEISNNIRVGTEGISLRRAKSAPYNRLTVSDCLVWRVPETSKQESVQNIETT
ncbi:ciliary microtubule inner protein 7 isoform X2 [Lithobates pipiens]